MRLSQIKETASAGATGAGAICTNLAGGTPPKGQFFGGDPTSSIYPTIKKHRKDRKEEVVKEGIPVGQKVKNWLIKNEKTGQFWNGKVMKGWTDRKNAELFSSDQHAFELPSYGRWVNVADVAEATKTAKPPAKPSGKAEVIGGKKPYKQPNVLSPTMKVKSTGKMLGGAEKKNPTLSTKFFGTCSATNDPGNKSIIAELTYREFRNASNAISKICPGCSAPFKNIHDVNQKFCSKECEGKGGVVLKLKEAWDKTWETFETKTGKIVDAATIRDLVKRVMADSNGETNLFQACIFVAGMLRNSSGWAVHFALEDLAKKEAAEMYKEK